MFLAEEPDERSRACAFFTRIISINKRVLMPIILIISLVGAYAINQNVFDIGVALMSGVIDYLMRQYSFPLSPCCSR